MYSIYADNTLIYSDISPLENLKIISPKLSLADNQAGSLTITIPKSNIGYDIIERLTTDITVYRGNEELWSGRVFTDKCDFYKNRILYCEGELAFLNDSIQPQYEYHNITVRNFLDSLIRLHNNKVTQSRQFTLGIVTVTDPNNSLYRYTNYETTLECINEKLVKRLGGHIRIRHEDGIRYIDYLADYPNTSSQIIEFGHNLMDFTKNWDMSDFATVILPLGHRLDESPIDALDAYLTVESVNDGSKYVVSANAVSAYGRIEKVIRWDDVTVPSNLLSKANSYLSEIQFDNMTIELKAIDLHYFDIEEEAINVLDRIKVKSAVHGMDRYFPVSKIDIPLDNPEDSVFTLGDNIKTSLTISSNQANTEILNRIENIPKKSEILQEAKDNATAIMRASTEGYITITKDNNHSESLYISDTPDYREATKMWLLNMNGFGYSNDGGETFGLAITMDGSIVADYITSGVLRGNLLQAGSVSANAISQSFKTSISNDINSAKSTVEQEFQAADGVLLSTISQTYATKSEMTSSISQTADSITTEVNKKVGKTEFGTYMEQNYTSFILAFNNNSSTIQLNTSGISIYTGTISDANKIINFNGDGMNIWRSGTKIGKIGTNSMTGYPSYKGLVFDLDVNGSYMTWAKRDSSTSNYDTMFTFARQGATFQNEGLYIDCNIYAKGNEIKSANLTDVRANGYTTYTGKRRFLSNVQFNAQGGLDLTYTEYDIKCGMFTN